MINIKRTLIATSVMLFLALGASGCSDTEETVDDLQLALGLAPQNFSCNITATSNQCVNLTSFTLLTAQALCTTSLSGTLSAADIKCPVSSTTSTSTSVQPALGVCDVTPANTALLTGDQTAQLVFYFSGTSGSSTAVEEPVVKATCENSLNPLNGIYTSGYTL